MPGIGNNLYPPIIDTYMPAFVRTAACKVYFSLSTYNDIKEIANAQIIVNNQSTNQSVLNPTTYPTGIKIDKINIDTLRETDDKYYIIIQPSDLIDNVFELNQFYKIQIRFTGIQAAELTDSTRMATWLNDNQQFFSEWSTVCLIKGIEQPQIYLKGFEHEGIDNNIEEINFHFETIELVGKLYYNENATIEKETLKSYRAIIYNESSKAIVYDTKDIYTNIYNPNEINYVAKVILEDGIRYRLEFSYVTTNNYTETKNFIFSVLQNSIDTLNATISAEPDIEYGRMKINILATIQEQFFGNITIRRTSSESDYTIWEDVHQVTLVDMHPLNYTWYDYTIESGVWYKYCAQRRNSKGDRGTIINIRYPVMMELEDIFLTRKDMQFRIRYNPEISSFKYVYSESKTDTLGSQFSYFRRNGNIKYREFPISGLITAFCDDQGIFLNKDNIYRVSKEDYNSYNKDQNIDEYQDYIYEREFREKIIDFLYADDIKLFRSPTEGNILIKLMDVSFTPNQTLGRMLYSFSATAYEFDECTIPNFERYGIQDIGEYSTKLSYYYDKIGQIIGTFSGQQNDLFTLLQDKYNKQTLNKYINTVYSIKWLRIEFVSDPYLIKTTSSGGLVKVTKNEKFTEDMAEGYIAYINNKPMIISPRRFIEFIDDDTKITSVYFPYSTEVIFDYIVEMEQTENTSLLYTKVYLYTRAGQLHDIFKPEENLFKKIYVKYLLNYRKYHQELLAIDKIIFEAEPGTVVYVRDSFDNDYFKHEIGSTGILELYDDEAIITGAYFSGLHLYPADTETTSQIEVRNENYLETGISVNSESEIKTPHNHCVYTIDGKRKIWYQECFYDFNEKDEVLCPIDGTIDYIYELLKGEY